MSKKNPPPHRRRLSPRWSALKNRTEAKPSG